MKSNIKRALALSFVVFIVVLPLQTYLVHAQSEPSAKDRALAFIESVIQPDMSKYNVTLLNDIIGQPLLWPPETQESITYFLSDNGVGPDINCMFINNSLTFVELSVDRAFVHSSNAEESQMLVYSNQPSNLTAQMIGLLERYQTYMGEDLQNMINTLGNVDVTQNITNTVGNIKLTTTNFSYETDVSFKYTYNGTDYTGISFTFRNGQFYGFTDNRSQWKIGNTDVNINQTQAINIAKQYMKTYSYNLEEGTVVNQFNVTSITANLNTYPKDNTTTVYPCWSIQVNLNDTFPAACYAIAIDIWADTGTVIFAQPQFVGGGSPPPLATSQTTTPIITPISSQQTQSTTQNNSLTLEVSIAAIAVAIAIISIIAVKKGKDQKQEA